MKAKLNYKGKKIEVKDIQKCQGLKKFTGLMFKKKEDAKAMFFDFKIPGRKAIHSLFCPEFLALWIDDGGKIVEWKFVLGKSVSIKPKKKFSRLLEVPLNKKYFDVVRLFLEGEEKSLNTRGTSKNK